MSKPLYSAVVSCDTIDRGDNLSDHLPVCCTISVDVCDTGVVNKSVKMPQNRVYKDRWDKADTLKYYVQTGVNLQNIAKPDALLCCADGCSESCHKIQINRFYEDIVRALKMSAVDCVPRIAVNALKQYWNENLDKLKQISIDMHAPWRTCGSPRSGVINAARLRAKFDFKSAVKKAERDFDRTHYDELNELFINKDTNNFWKSWSAKFSKKSSSTTMIDGNSNDQKIADKFADHFCSMFVDSSNDVNAVNNYKHIASERSNETVLNSYSDVDLELVESCISALKPCKAAGHDGIAPEHLLFSHPCLVTHLKLLFALMFKHEYVPEAFGKGIIIVNMSLLISATLFYMLT